MPRPRPLHDLHVCKHAAEAKGFGDALMLDYRGYLAETTGANLFMVINGELHTPKPDCFLNGITRRTVIDLAKKRGIPVIERHIKPEELSEVQEFVTGTAAEDAGARDRRAELPARADHAPAHRRLSWPDPRPRQGCLSRSVAGGDGAAEHPFSVGVFCGSRSGHDLAHTEAAIAIGESIGRRGRPRAMAAARWA